jgi:hypothetical protein
MRTSKAMAHIPHTIQCFRAQYASLASKDYSQFNDVVNGWMDIFRESVAAG